MLRPLIRSAAAAIALAASSAPVPAADPGDALLDGVVGFVVYLDVCDQFDKANDVMMANVMSYLAPYSMERRRASRERQMAVAKEIGIGKFCSEMASQSDALIRTLGGAR